MGFKTMSAVGTETLNWMQDGYTDLSHSSNLGYIKVFSKSLKFSQLLRIDLIMWTISKNNTRLQSGLQGWTTLGCNVFPSSENNL